mgnify:CR=1 FL=1
MDGHQDLPPPFPVSFSQYYCSNHFFIDLVCLEDIKNPLPPPFPSLANVIATIVIVLQICPISTPLIQLLFPRIIFHRNVGLDVWSKLQRTPREFWYLTAETLVTLDNIVQTVAPDVTKLRMYPRRPISNRRRSCILEIGRAHV